MTEFEKKKLECDFRDFTSKNFEKPSNCRNGSQIRFYIKELCSKIEQYEKQFSYVPEWAYVLLSQYTSVQNSMVHIEFVRSYS